MSAERELDDDVRPDPGRPPIWTSGASADGTALPSAEIISAPEQAPIHPPPTGYDGVAGNGLCVHQPRSPVSLRSAWLQGAGSLLGSTAFHLVAVVVLALWMLPQVTAQLSTVLHVDLTERDARLDTIVLDEPLEVAIELTSPTGQPNVRDLVSLTGLVSTPQLNTRLVQRSEAGKQLEIEAPQMAVPAPRRLISAVPDGALGDPRAIVDNYDQAMDRITQEIMWMLARSRVLLIWCFDQSESMKDDQQEIRSRIDRVYAELGLAGHKDNDAFTTAVTSFGGGFRVHTRRPTSRVQQIREAIRSVPLDPSGKEMMCAAAATSIAQHAKYAERGHRQMALVKDKAIKNTERSKKKVGKKLVNGKQ